jgi:hypothetical protein
MSARTGVLVGWKLALAGTEAPVRAARAPRYSADSKDIIAELFEGFHSYNTLSSARSAQLWVVGAKTELPEDASVSASSKLTCDIYQVIKVAAETPGLHEKLSTASASATQYWLLLPVHML